MNVQSTERTKWPLYSCVRVPRALLAATACLSLAASCSHQHDQLPPQPARDSKEGLTLQAVPGEPKGLQATYRAGSQRLHFLLLERSEADGYAKDDAGLCVRIEDGSGRVVDSAGPASCPDQLGVDRAGADAAIAFDDLLARNEALRAAALQLADGGAAADTTQLAKPLAQLSQHVARLVEMADARPPVSPALLVREERNGESTSQAANPPKAKTKNGLFSLPMFGPIDHWFARDIVPAERHENAQLEFTQEVHLYGKKVKKYVIFGEPGLMDHTATVLLVKARPVGSDEAWQLYRRAVTSNHGTIATDPSMTNYAVCADMPITTGWFAWKGECPGSWGDDHLCNDDTRLQLWHAYGQYSEQPYCKHVFQAQRPFCRKPW